MPTLAGFNTFIRSSMGISMVVLPVDAPVIADSYALAIETVNEVIQLASLLYYDLAVYNLAGDILINNAPDQSVTNASITWASNLGTVTTSVPHGYTTGTMVLVSAAAPLGYNTDGTTPVVVTGASTYQYAIEVNPGIETQPGISSLTFFAELRKTWDITGFVAGVIQSSADVSTSESLLVPDAFKGLQIGDLQNLKTPWGRQYLAIAQRYGTLWGLT